MHKEGHHCRSQILSELWRALFKLHSWWVLQTHTVNIQRRINTLLALRYTAVSNNDHAIYIMFDVKTWWLPCLLFMMLTILSSQVSLYETTLDLQRVSYQKIFEKSLLYCKGISSQYIWFEPVLEKRSLLLTYCTHGRVLMKKTHQRKSQEYPLHSRLAVMESSRRCYNMTPTKLYFIDRAPFFLDLLWAVVVKWLRKTVLPELPTPLPIATMGTVT